MKESQNPIGLVSNYLLTTGDFNLRKDKLYNGSLKTSNVVRSLIADEKLLDELGIFRHVKGSDFRAGDFNTSVIEALKEVLTKKNREESQEMIDAYIDTEAPTIDPNIFTIYKNIEEEMDRNDKDKFLVLSSDSSLVKNVSISTYRHLISEESYAQLKPQIPLAYIAYDPYRINDTLQDKRWMERVDSFDAKVTHINKCVHPKWRYNRDKTLKLTMEEIYFIESSFTSEADLQYYIDAAYHTVIDKMWSYVMLYGIKGTGKTTLIEMLIPCVGKDNYRKAPQNALQKEFNGFKKDKRLILMDEMVANSDKAVNILKSDANKEFNVEEKSQISESVQNFVSMWIATNNISDWKFTHDERRFSSIGLTKQTTEDRGIEDSWMEAFSAKIETEEWANAFFNYLEANKSETFNTMAPYKTELFWRVVYESLKPWQMRIVDEITLGAQKDELLIADLYDEHDKYQPANHKVIIDFLENYRHEGLELGTYDRRRSIRNSLIIPNEKFRPVTDKGEL